MAESRQHTYQLTRPGESYCQPCLRNGHQCMTTGHDGDEYICAFCEDGVACPVMKAAVKPSNGFRTTGIATALTNGTGDERRKGGRVPIGGIVVPTAELRSGARAHTNGVHKDNPTMSSSNVAKQPAIGPAARAGAEPKIEKERTMEKRICSVGGCGQALIASNKSGHCSKHFCQSKADRVGPLITKTGAVDKRSIRHAAKLPSGLSFTPAPGNRKSHTNGGGEFITLPMRITEADLDRMYLRMSTREEKIAKVSNHILAEV